MSSHPGCALEDAIELSSSSAINICIQNKCKTLFPTPEAYRHVCTIRALTHWMENPYMLQKGRDKAKQRALMQYKKY